MSFAKISFVFVVAALPLAPAAIAGGAGGGTELPRSAAPAGTKPDAKGPAPTGRSVNGPASNGAGTGENKPSATGGGAGGGTEQQ